MPSPVPYRDVLRALNKNGWTLDRTTGSHRIFCKEGERFHISIPVHAGDVKHKYVRGLEKRHGIRV